MQPFTNGPLSFLPWYRLVYLGPDKALVSIPKLGVVWATGVVPTGVSHTKDGKYVIIGGNGDSIYTRLMAAVGRPEMGAQNPDFANNSKRMERESEIYEVCLK